MGIIVDLSCYLAVLLNEDSRKLVEDQTKESELLGPGCLYWEMGNALYSAIKRKMLDLGTATSIFTEFCDIPVRLLDCDFHRALDIAANTKIPTYDAYYLQCAEKYQKPLLTLDKRMKKSAESLGIKVL